MPLNAFSPVGREPSPVPLDQGADQTRLFRMAAEYSGAGDPPVEALESWMMHSLSVLPYAYPATYPLGKDPGRANPTTGDATGAGPATEEWSEWGGYEDRVLAPIRMSHYSPSGTLATTDRADLSPTLPPTPISPRAGSPAGRQSTSHRDRSRLSLDSYRPAALPVLGLGFGLGLGLGLGRQSLHASAAASGTSLLTPPLTAIATPSGGSASGEESTSATTSALATASVPGIASEAGPRRRGGRGRRRGMTKATSPPSTSRPFKAKWLAVWGGERRASAPDRVAVHDHGQGHGYGSGVSPPGQDPEAPVGHADLMAMPEPAAPMTQSPTLALPQSEPDSAESVAPVASCLLTTVETEMAAALPHHLRPADPTAQLALASNPNSSPADEPPAYDQVVF